MTISYNGCSCDFCYNKFLESYKEAKSKWDQGERKIDFEIYNTSCGDGYCWEMGTNVYVNGLQLNCNGENLEDVTKAILEFLGYEDVSIEFTTQE